MQNSIVSLLTTLVMCLFTTVGSVAQKVQNANVTIPILNYEEVSTLWKTPSDTIYVVNFWATWCGPCIKELPHFEKLRTSYADKNVKVLLVSLDFKKNYESALLPFVKRRKIKAQVVLLSDPDANEWVPKVDADWSGAIPATLIVNPVTGQRAFYEKTFNYEELETALKPFIQTK